MTATLLKFGFILVVIMIGFAMALHVLFRDRDGFGETVLGLFNAMLGDTDLFDEFSGERYDGVATVLLVVYLFIVTIMLLNLLIAILSTSHAQVQDNVEREFKVSKARIVEHYRVVVENDLLPAPFNVVSLISDLVKLTTVLLESVGCLPCCTKIASRCCFLWISESPEKSWHRARSAYGRLVFCVVLGTVAVVGGALLWVLSSVPYAQYAWYTHYKEDKATGKTEPLGFPRRAWQCFRVFLWCMLGAPFCLVVLWVAAFVRVLWVFLRCWVLLPRYFEFEYSKSTAPPTTIRTIGSMLRTGPGGVGADKLRGFLEDPMDDKDVRQDEKDRRTTVEHMKLLRNRLEATTKKELNELRSDVKEMGEQLQRVLRIVEKQN